MELTYLGNAHDRIFGTRDQLRSVLLFLVHFAHGNHNVYKGNGFICIIKFQDIYFRRYCKPIDITPYPFSKNRLRLLHAKLQSTVSTIYVGYLWRSLLYRFQCGTRMVCAIWLSDSQTHVRWFHDQTTATSTGVVNSVVKLIKLLNALYLIMFHCFYNM